MKQYLLIGGSITVVVLIMAVSFTSASCFEIEQASPIMSETNDEYHFEDVDLIIFGSCRSIGSDGTWTGGLYIGFQSASHVVVSDGSLERLNIVIYENSISDPIFSHLKETKMTVSMSNVEGLFFWSCWKQFSAGPISPLVFVLCHAKDVWIRY